MGPKSAKSAKYRGILRVYLETPGYTWKIPCDRLGIVPISSILPQILPQTSSQTQGNSRVSRMEHQTPSVFPGNFRKRKVLGALCFRFCLPEKYIQANVSVLCSLKTNRFGFVALWARALKSSTVVLLVQSEDKHNSLYCEEIELPGGREASGVPSSWSRRGRANV